MGPVALFDKSFLQSISADESVWFDHFFLPLICPVFYVETLGNLAKAATKVGPGRGHRPGHREQVSGMGRIAERLSL